MKFDLKKIGRFLIILSILNLLGCSNVNEKTAKEIDEKLTEKYNEEFTVQSLGNRYGTKSNDTVMAYVKSEKRDIVFSVVMKKSGEITSENYKQMILMHKFANVFDESVRKQKLEGSSRVNTYTEHSGENEITYNMTIDEYLNAFDTKRIYAEIILKENDKISSTILKSIVRDVYKHLNNTSIGVTFWVFEDSEYKKVNEEIKKVANIDSTVLNNYSFKSAVNLTLDENGFRQADDEIEKQLNGSNE